MPIFGMFEEAAFHSPPQRADQPIDLRDDVMLLRAAGLAFADKTTVQKVDTKKLRGLLRKQGAVLDAGSQPQVKPTVNQRQETTPFLWVPVGGFEFKAGNGG